MSFDDNLSQAAHRLRNSAEDPGPSDASRAHVLDGIHTVAAPEWRKRNARGWITGSATAVAMSLLAMAVLVQQHLARIHRTTYNEQVANSVKGAKTPEQLAALPQVKFALQVQQSVDRQNTWHFVGWQDNQFARQHWEIWGRTKPFFFREQIGDVVTIDDGSTHKVIVPRGTLSDNVVKNRESGPLVYITDSRLYQGGPFFTEIDLTGLIMPGVDRTPFFMGPGGLNQKHRPSAAEMKAQGAIANLRLLSNMIYEPNRSDNGQATDQLSHEYSSTLPGSDMAEQLRVDPRTHLPRQYRVLRAEPGREDQNIPPYQKGTDSLQMQALLTEQYNIDIPKDLESYSPPTDSQIVDMRPVMSQRIAENMSIRLSEIQRDKQGNLRVKLTPNFTNVFKVNPRLTDYIQVNLEHSAYASDKQGAIFPVTMMDDGQQPAAMVLWFTVPASAQAASLKPLTLHLPLDVSFYGPGGVNGGTLNSVLNVLSNRSYDWLKFDVTLPPSADVDLRPRYTVWRIGGGKPYSLAETAAIAQARFYSDGGEETSLYRDPIVARYSHPGNGFYRSWPVSPATAKPSLSDENRRLAAQWWRTAAAEAAKVGDTISARTFSLRAAKFGASDADTPSRTRE